MLETLIDIFKGNSEEDINFAKTLILNLELKDRLKLIELMCKNNFKLTKLHNNGIYDEYNPDPRVAFEKLIIRRPEDLDILTFIIINNR